MLSALYLTLTVLFTYKNGKFIVFNDDINSSMENIEKIKSSDLKDVASVVKTLFMREKEKPLSSVERKMLVNAKNILISELVLSKKSTYDEIEGLLALNF